MKNSLRIHKWTHNEFNIFILGVLTHPHLAWRDGCGLPPALYVAGRQPATIFRRMMTS